MQIRFTKGKGKPDTLTCLRDDGSQTWAVLNDTAHDFGHYAAEMALGWHDAFFGLLAQGRDISDFGRADPTTGRKPDVPIEALQAEILAGLLDVERVSGDCPAYAVFQDMLESTCASLNVPVPPLTPGRLAAIRRSHTDLLRYWEQMPEGEALELTF